MRSGDNLEAGLALRLHQPMAEPASLRGLRRSQLLGWLFAAHAARDLPCRRPPAGAIMTPQPPGIRGMSDKMVARRPDQLSVIVALG
jgi:hypothetical protein